MKIIKLVLSYDGTNFKGWAQQPGLRTIESEIRKSLQKIFGEYQAFFVGGRTDAGVHALNQVVSFKTDLSPNFPATGIRKAMNSVLPNDIYIKNAEIFLEDSRFNARFDAVSRSYFYNLQHSSLFSVFDRNYITYFDKPIIFSKIEESIDLLIGKHNFRGFSSSSTDSVNFNREIFAASIEGDAKKIKLKIKANGFLTHMIRLIMGTLLFIGQEKFSNERIIQILKTGRRGLTGPTTSSQGLYLQKVEYGN